MTTGWFKKWGVLYQRSQTTSSITMYTCELFIANNPATTIAAHGYTAQEARTKLYHELNDFVYERCRRIKSYKS